MKKKPIPVIDLFAGPGGLGEGFSSFSGSAGSNGFNIRLSIEKDENAHETLLLRSFFRQFDKHDVPDEYYESVCSGDFARRTGGRELYKQFPDEAARAAKEVMLAELGVTDSGYIHSRISEALDNDSQWVLIGGPPCQAYSVVGRSRNRGIADYKPEDDSRQYLYIEYLQVIAEHKPTVFIMENVKGLLSATLRNKRILSRIIDDLTDPLSALAREGRSINHRNSEIKVPEYLICPLASYGDRLCHDSQLSDYIVNMEKHGIPQSRHRLILVGIRTDFTTGAPEVLRSEVKIPVRDVLSGLPRLRSGLSRGPDDPDSWIDNIKDMETYSWFKRLPSSEVKHAIADTLLKFRKPVKGRGGECVSYNAKISYRPEWYLDSRLKGVLNHTTRGHISSDLHRYLFAACFAKVHGRSPDLGEFPSELLPAHKNAKNLSQNTPFKDRFRVQVADTPASTITSHISKDGHYYIHPDPSQCRSLTVREAARIQTFPDNYLFCGPRTSQYIQVGNAVPPLLANKIASIVYDMLS